MYICQYKNNTQHNSRDRGVSLRCLRFSSYGLEPQPSSFVVSISGMIKSCQVARYSMSFPFSLKKNREIKARYLHIFYYSLVLFKIHLFYVYAFRAHCFRFVVLLHVIHNRIKGFKQKTQKIKIQTIKQH